MRAGFETVDITPPVGAALNGFIARLSPSQGVDAPLAGRALALESGEVCCLIIGLDLLGLSPVFADRCVAELSACTGMPREHIVLSCSHTHSGPMTAPLRGIGPADEAYLDQLAAKLCRGAEQACKTLVPVVVSWGTAPVCIGVNRRALDGGGKAVLGVNPGGPCDQAVRVLHLRSDERSIVLFHHACHPYCLGAEHPLISADYWGHAASLLKGAGHECLYLNGCAGDIAPQLAFSGPDGGRRTGHILAKAVLEACASARPERNPILRVGSAEVLLEHDQLTSWPELESCLSAPDRTVRAEESGQVEVQTRLRASWREWLQDLRRAATGGDRLAPLKGRISALRIGGGALIALPGEVFFEAGQRIAARLQADPVCIAAYGHGYIGYIPDAMSFQHGGYEVDESHRYVGLWRVSPDSEAVLSREVDRLWNKIEGEPR